jgi:outer membrane protein, multidrug efflux system
MRIFAFLLPILFISGCATTSPMLQPRVDPAPAYSEAATPAGTAVTADWWKTFGSSELQTLVDEALAGSPDLAIAMERVRQAEAQVRVSGASLFPVLSAGYSSRASRSSPGNGTSNSGVSLAASYEVDLWGRNAAGVRAAQADLRATTFDRDTARLTLLSGVATAYFEALSLRSRLATARENLAIAQRVLSLVQARAALLPSIQLTGSAGVASSALLAVLNAPVSTLAIAASVLQPIFDGGRLKGQVSIAESRERELVESYRKAILTAFADVEQALAAASRLGQREALQAQVQDRAREALRLAEVRYREGADDLLSVLDAQRTLFDAQDQLAQIRRDRLESAVALYKALGGGWQA